MRHLFGETLSRRQPRLDRQQAPTKIITTITIPMPLANLPKDLPRPSNRLVRPSRANKGPSFPFISFFSLLFLLFLSVLFLSLLFVLPILPLCLYSFLPSFLPLYLYSFLLIPSFFSFFHFLPFHSFYQSFLRTFRFWGSGPKGPMSCRTQG